MSATVVRSSIHLVREPEPTAESEYALGQEAERAGRRPDARQHFERAISLVRTGGEVTVPMLMRRIALTYHVDLDLDAAEDCALAARAVSEAQGDEVGVGHAMNILAVLEWRRGRLDEAEQLYLDARTRARRSGDVQLAAMASQNLGIMASMNGDLRGALRFYHSSLADYRSLGASPEILRTLNNLGMLYSDLERWDAAQRAYAEAVEIGTHTGELSTLITVQVNVADMWIARRDFARAAEAVARADELAATLGDPHADGDRARVNAILHRERGACPESEEAFRRAIDFAVEHGDLLLEAETSRELADLYRRQGRNRDALQFLTRAHRLFSGLRSQRALADIERRNAKLETEFLAVVQRWGESIEAKDVYTQGHCERVADLACALATRAGVPPESMFWLRVGALLHDVGKLVVPAEILNKSGQLSPSEWEVIRTHPGAGIALLSDVDFPGDVLPIVRGHHEHWEGGGYPDGLAGEEIPLAARIVCIADVYDALTSARSYATSYTHLQAMEIMRRDVGHRFDPALFELFEAIVRDDAPLRPLVPRITPVTPGMAVGGGDDSDDLTSVLTRRAFVEAVAVSLERRAVAKPGALLVLDIDLFKRVNDVFGHLRGDDVLRAVAEVLGAHTDGKGLVGRFGGDEFVVWLPSADQDEALHLAEIVRDAIQRRRVVGDQGAASIAVTVSIGVAACPKSGRTFEDLFAAADRAMYDAKRLGRNCVGSTGDRASLREATLTPERFVGRSRELEQLSVALDETLRCRPQLVLLSGDAGVGKTTLVRQLAAESRARGGAFVCGQCFESDLRPPYGPWVEALTGLIAQDAVAPRAWRELPRIVPGSGTASADSPPSKYALYEEVTDLLRAASTAQPLTLVLEDMQWADSAAWDLLEHVQSRLANERLLICLTVRDDPMRTLDTDRRIRLSRDERLRTVPLGPLGGDEIRVWLESVLDRRDVSDLLAIIQARTEGNPLLVNQLLRAMLDERTLWHDGTRWQWRLERDVRLPATAYDLFARRIDRVAPLSKRVLAFAAVIGRRFDLDLLIAAGGWAEDDVLEAIDDAVDAGVIERVGGADAEHFSFCHGLVHETIRANINPRRAQRMHQRVAEAIERRDPSAAAQLAEHYDRAGSATRAYGYAMRAGEAAADVHAPEDAIAFFQAATRHARTTAEKLAAYRAMIRVVERMGVYTRCETLCTEALEVLADDLAAADRLWLNVQQARMQFLCGAMPTDTLRTCVRLTREADRLCRPAERVDIAILESLAFGRCGDFGAAERAAGHAVAQAQATGNGSLEITALLRLGTIVVERDAEQALRVYRDAMELAERLGDLHAEARCRVAVGVACARSQRDEAAVTAYETARALAERIRAVDVAGLAAMNLGVLRLHAGQLAAARAEFAVAIERFGLVNNEARRLLALYNAASVEREAGDASGAAELYNRARELAVAIGHRDITLGATAGAALAHLRLGRGDAANSAAATLRTEMAAEGDRWFQCREMIEALLIRASINAGAVDDAVRQFTTALALAEKHDRYGAAWLAAEVATDLVAAGYAGAYGAAQRFAPYVAGAGYVSLAARYVVLQDLADRESIKQGPRR